MPRQVRLFQISDWTAGLNFREDMASLNENETPDCMNVRILPQGGFERRKTIGNVNDTGFTAGNMRNLWQFLGNGVSQIIVQDGNDAAYSTGTGTFTAINPDALATTGIMRAASMARISSANSERCYIQRNAEQVAWKWSGSAATVLAAAEGAYNENIAAPAGGRMPTARYIVSHQNFMFHGYTVEGGTTFKSRIRFSHPLEPEDYRANDFIDVGANDGDVITGLASMASVLYIFKKRSVWALTGYDTLTFQLQKVADGLGAVNQEAIASNDSEVFFFDQAKGVFAISPTRQTTGYSSAPSRVAWLWPKLAPKLTDNTIPHAYVPNVTMGWLDSRLFVAVPWRSSTTNTRTFVFDPLCGKEGAWYLYRYGSDSAPIDIGPMLEWGEATSTGANRFLAIGNGGTYLYYLMSANGTTDTVASGPTTTTFSSYLTTAFFAAGKPGLKKRWRRPTFVVDATTTVTLGVSVYADYKSLTAKSTNSVLVTSAAGGGAVWGEFTWGAFTWGPAAEKDQQIVRGTGFGSAYTIALKISAAPASPAWGLNLIDFRYIPKTIR